jgi:hypothetical protein
LALRSGLFGGLFALVALQAQAAAPTLEQLQHMPGPMRAEVIKRLMAEQASRRPASNSLRALDVTPPVVTAFNVGSELDADDIRAQLVFSVSVSDDFSGLEYLSINAISPSGNQFWGTGMNFSGQKKFSGKLTMGARAYAEVGTYIVRDVFVGDVAGNYSHCDSACLARMGNNRFVVTASVSDTQPPTLVSGQVLTAKLSASKPAKGTESRAPYISVQLDITDLGQSGLEEVVANFCRLGHPGETCLYVGAQLYSREVGENVRVIAGGGLYESSAGIYELESIWARDRAGNTSTYKSTKFGGDTDFTQLFPSTTITLVP